MNTITKPKPEKLPKTNIDVMKILITDGEAPEDDTMSVLQETNKTAVSKMLVGNSLMGALAKTASSFKPDKE